MRRHAVFDLSVAGVLAVVFSLTFSCGASLAAATCLRGPNRHADPGYHWYYRVDRANSGHCWYQKKVESVASADGLPQTEASPNTSNSSKVLSWLSSMVSSVRTPTPPPAESVAASG